MKLNSILSESKNTVELHQIALDIHSMAQRAWEEQYDEYPSNEQTLEAIKSILEELKQELMVVVKEYSD